MSPRPRRISDQQLLHAAAGVLAERGIAAVRLADVTAASGLAPATLVQRFGSLDRLIAEVLASLRAEVGEAFLVPAATALDRLIGGLARIAESRHLGLLIGHPEAAGYSLELRKQIAFCLLEAVEAGELPPCDVATVARRIQIEFYGHFTAGLLEGEAMDRSAVEALVEQQLDDLR